MIKKMKRFAATMIAIVISFLLFMTVPAFAQSIADAARQERERKKAVVRETHVYTNEDLAKPQILVPEDQARIMARKDRAPGPTVASVPAEPPATGVAPAQSPEALKSARSVVPFKAKSTRQVAGPPINSTVPGETVVAEPASIKAPLVATKRKTLSSPRLGDIPLPVINLPEEFEVASPLRMAMPVVFGPDFNRGSLAGSEPAKPAISGRASAPKAEGHSSLPPVIGGSPTISGIPAELPTIPYPVVYVGTQPPVTRQTVRPLIAEPPVMRSAYHPAYDLQPWLAAPVIEPPVATKANRDVLAADSPHLPTQLPARVVATATEARTVLVRAGDSLWRLAERYIGNGEHWREIAQLNPQIQNPSLIRPGEPIRLPVWPSQNVKKIIVRRGDTLWSLARTELGQPLAFACIAYANQLQSVDAIQAGETLVVPESCGVSR